LRTASRASWASADHGNPWACRRAWSTSVGVTAAETHGTWSRAHRSFCRPTWERIGDTAFRWRKRSLTAASSFPVTGAAHSFEAATQSLSGTGRATPSPAWNVRSLSTRRRVFRTADDASYTSSRKA
jgi:hypothetical protein